MRILLSKPDALGDQLIAAGAVQALRTLRPDIQIVWHVRRGMEVVASLLGGDVFAPQTDQPPESEATRLAQTAAPLVFLPYPLSSYEPWSDDVGRRVKWWAAFLQATRWDAAILGLVNRTWVGDLTVALAPASQQIGFAASAARQPLVNEAHALVSAGAPVFTTTLEPSWTRSESDQLRDLLAVLEPRLATGAAAAWRAPVSWEPRTSAPSTAHVLIAPGVGGDPRRAWPLGNFRAVADGLRSRGARVTWVEGPGDSPYLAGLPADDQHPRAVFGPTDLPKLNAAFAGADLVICHDTAYAHLAAGIGVPTVAIYGAGQVSRFHPTGGRVKVVQSRIACAGCQWHCLFERLHCVADIPLATVESAVEHMLRGDASPVFVDVRTPFADAPEGELLALRHRLQQEILTLNADRFARLQIIQSLLAQPKLQPASLQRPETEPRLSVIIPMGRPDRVAATLASLAAQQRVPANWEIILVGVEAAAVARAHPHLPVVPVVLSANQLPPRTRCLGVEKATGEWYLFIDDDVELATDCYARLLDLLASPMFSPAANPRVGAIGLRLPGKSGRFFERLTDISNFWAQQHSAAEDRDWLYSAAVFVLAEAYHRSGGFNPDLPNGEDVDLTRRIVGAGYRLRYEPSLVARHDHRRDTLLSMWRYFWKNGNAAQYFFAAQAGACPFSVKTAWLKSWSDLRMNMAFQRARGVQLGLRTPLIWLNYLIVEASLEQHWQEYLHRSGRYRELPARARSDVTYVQALTGWDAGRRVRGACRYALAVLQDFANPVRR
ncbi:glycosyltransferase family 9 protein [Opitutus terrae]|uniref:Glycosyl transferase family 9 n=1 Tax=Opitutus terrae (strain DSM 11246 / JCM 15787 / PB90-1) TaxID=452637 RepID=B1ZZN8_OPITP|nr:glycosyltransferase family 9 protein [Opitutus terrae]ACB77224.1 glycosyl transferase family 9 [Opitutus terrae PB90-1]